MHFFLFLKNQFKTRKNQKSPEDIDNGMEIVHERHTAGDKKSPHNKSTENSPKQDFVLIPVVNFEIGKDKFSVGANVMLPITQNLNGGNLEANYRWSLNLNYSL